jgi:hypothetical protein
MAKSPRTQAADDAATAAATAQVIRVKALQPSRWRAGRQFGPVPVDIPAAGLSEDDLARLNADPLLVVTAGSDALTAEAVTSQE